MNLRRRVRPLVFAVWMSWSALTLTGCGGIPAILPFLQNIGTVLSTVGTLVGGKTGQKLQKVGGTIGMVTSTVGAVGNAVQTFERLANSSGGGSIGTPGGGALGGAGDADPDVVAVRSSPTGNPTSKSVAPGSQNPPSTLEVLRAGAGAVDALSTIVTGRPAGASDLVNNGERLVDAFQASRETLDKGMASLRPTSGSETPSSEPSENSNQPPGQSSKSILPEDGRLVEQGGQVYLWKNGALYTRDGRSKVRTPLFDGWRYADQPAPDPTTPPPSSTPQTRGVTLAPETNESTSAAPPLVTGGAGTNTGPSTYLHDLNRWNQKAAQPPQNFAVSKPEDRSYVQFGGRDYFVRNRNGQLEFYDPQTAQRVYIQPSGQWKYTTPRNGFTPVLPRN